MRHLVREESLDIDKICQQEADQRGEVTHLKKWLEWGCMEE